VIFWVKHFSVKFGSMPIRPGSRISRVTTLRQIRLSILIVIFGLVLSGVTAFPLLHEMNWLSSLIAGGSKDPAMHVGFVKWILTVREGLEVTYAEFPFIAYGTDWLAFAHLMIALFFILPWRDPVRYKGVLHIGVVMSVLVIPLALICGPIRGIPFWWRMIDCSFGILCLPPLLFALWKIRLLENENSQFPGAPARHK
jgi:hypothetical protein